MPEVAEARNGKDVDNDDRIDGGDDARADGGADPRRRCCRHTAGVRRVRSRDGCGGSDRTGQHDWRVALEKDGKMLPVRVGERVELMYCLPTHVMTMTLRQARGCT
jgi:hypothetical protein